jgi:hypothetical protein
MADTTEINVNRAYQNAWIVYINGLEVPVSSVSVSYGVWQIPQAEIVMIPDPVLQRLGREDRITVQIFYCDQWLKPSKPEFRLLFDGEIIGWSYVNVQRGRSISFTAVDYIQIFTQLFFFFMSNIDDLAIGAVNSIASVNADVGVQTAGFAPLYPYSLFAQGLLPTSTQSVTNADGTTTAENVGQIITRPIDYVYNVVRGLAIVPNDRCAVPAANFFRPWAQRTVFDKRFIALPRLESAQPGKGIFPILRAVQANYAVDAVAGFSSQVGSSGSIWNMFEQVLSSLMMEIAMIPTASAVQINTETLDILGPATKTESGKAVGLANYFTKPQFLFGLPPSCNVFFPSQVQQFGYQENYATQPTRMYFNDSSWINYLGIQNATAGLQHAVRTAISVAHPEEVHEALRRGLVNGGAENTKNVLVYPEEFFRGPVIDRREMPRWFLFLQKARDAHDEQARANVALASDKDAAIEDRIQAARHVLPGDEPMSLFRLYAAYEYAKERYSRRNAGLSMVFNPYPVPGFPCAVFDRRSTQVDVVGYIMNVRHVLSSRQMMTDVSVSYARTLQESFAIVRKQIELENAVGASNRAAVEAQISSGLTGAERMAASTEMRPHGLLAMGPAEPLSEIRDVIQSFAKAEEFYGELFYRGIAAESTGITPNQTSADVARDSETPDNASHPPDAPYAAQDTRIDTFLKNKKASFYYPDIIQVLSEKDKKASEVMLGGIEQQAVIKLVAIVDKMRVGEAKPEEIEAVSTALSLTTPIVQQDTDPNKFDFSIDVQLNVLEAELESAVLQTNLSGDVGIVPHPKSARLFESYQDAMHYNARPICTLDEYIAFLHDQASVSGRVGPAATLASGAFNGRSERVFPAPYYKRIRKYRAGPPAIVPVGNITNSPYVTGPSGNYVIQGSAVAQDSGPPPANQSLSDPAQSSAADTTNQSGPTDTLTGPPPKPIDSIPADFPQTSRDWDTILEEYRANVLSRLSPGT